MFFRIGQLVVGTKIIKSVVNNSFFTFIHFSDVCGFKVFVGSRVLICN